MQPVPDAPRPARRRMRTPWLIGGGLVAASAVVATVLFATGAFGGGDDETGGLPSALPPKLKVGDCFDVLGPPGGSGGIPRDKVSCKQAHDAETFAVVAVEAGNGDADAYPGGEMLERTARERCPSLADEYTQGAWRDPARPLRVTYTFPTEPAWVVDGVRGVTCALRSDSGEKLVGSVRGGR